MGDAGRNVRQWAEFEIAAGRPQLEAMRASERGALSGFTIFPFYVLFKALPRLTDEHLQLTLLYGNDGDSPALSLGRQGSLELAGWHKERNGEFLLVSPSCLEQAPRFQRGWFCFVDGDHLRSQDEAASRVHEAEAIKGSILFRSNGLIVQPKRYPGFIDVKLIRMQHVCSFRET